MSCIAGHDFEPRYDLSEPIIAPHIVPEIPYDEIAENIYETFRKRTYVCEVCVRCGLMVERPIKPA